MVVGLTGFSGTGKSTVAALLRENGFHHIDCDRIVHEEVYKDSAVLTAIAAAFGEDTIKDGTIDRIALRSRTLGNPAAVSRLNQVVMPHIIAAIEKHLKNTADQNVILDAPLLFEYGLEKKCTHTLSVIADEGIALSRIIKRDQIDEETARKRLSSQHPAAYYIEKSDYVITNNDDTAALKKQVNTIIKKLYD